MRKINFKQGRYVLPLMFLPFFFLAFYIYDSFALDKETTVIVKNDVNSDLAPPSANVTNDQLADKMAEYKRNFKNGDGYTAINPLQAEQSQRPELESLYSDDEKRMLDSLEKEMEKVRARGEEPNTGFRPRSEDLSENDKVLLSMLNQKPEQKTIDYEEEKPPNPTDMMKEQFRLMDSLEKANNPEYQEELRQQQQLEEHKRRLEELEASRFSVQKASMTKGIFNTIKAKDSESFIKAIVDEDITVYAGSRIRLKLMEDILVGKELVPKGTYLYATINGFTQQRITFNVESIMKGSNILPINLEIYDMDGMRGLYVPASAFREFTKQLGGNSMQGMNLTTSGTQDQSQFLMSTIQKAFQSTSTAISKVIKQNKANIKYSTYIFLIDPQELKNKQQNEKAN